MYRFPLWVFVLLSALLVTGGYRLFRYGMLEGARQYGAFLRAHSSIDDPANPPRVIKREWSNGPSHHTVFYSAGGRSTFHPPAGFQGLDKLYSELDERFSWVRWPGIITILVGLALAPIAIALRFLRIL